MNKLKISLMALTMSLFGFNAKSQYQNIQGDIEYDIYYTFQHDSTQCHSEIYYSDALIIYNSFLNDTVKVVYNNFSQIDTFINTSGNSTWTIFQTLLGMPIEIIPDQLANGNNVFFGQGTIFDKIICGPDTLHNVSFFGGEIVNDLCTYQTITGKTYIDKDNDCTFGANDVGVGWYSPSVSTNVPSPQIGSNTYGDYTVTIQESWFTNATISVNPNFQFVFPNNGCAPYSYTVNSLPQTGLDFVLQCADVDVYVGANYPMARPTVPFIMFPHASNFGCDSISGTLNLVLDPNVTYNASNSVNPADVVSGDTLKWFYTDITNVSNGAYWQTFWGGIELTPNASLNAGDVINFKVFTGVPSNDVNPNNNTHNFSITLVNSYDPNFKEVSPKGIGTPGYISANNEKFTYTVHFQNTGNAPALNISVIDSLDANVIPSSLKIISSSHVMTPEWVANDVIKFRFNNINLPDSASNEPQSHGYVTFEIDMAQNLAELTEIKNKAYIYFDNNAPIITNAVLNTIEALNLEEITGNNMSVIVYPNPSTDFTTISVEQFEEGSKLTFQLMDVSGKIVLTKNFTSSKMTVNTNELDKGVYLYTIWNESTQQFVNGKLIVE